jgi:hypothetical protein
MALASPGAEKMWIFADRRGGEWKKRGARTRVQCEKSSWAQVKRAIPSTMSSTRPPAQTGA